MDQFAGTILDSVIVFSGYVSCNSFPSQSFVCHVPFVFPGEASKTGTIVMFAKFGINRQAIIILRKSWGVTIWRHSYFRRPHCLSMTYEITVKNNDKNSWYSDHTHSDRHQQINCLFTDDARCVCDRNIQNFLHCFSLSNKRIYPYLNR